MHSNAMSLAPMTFPPWSRDERGSRSISGHDADTWEYTPGPARRLPQFGHVHGITLGHRRLCFAVAEPIALTGDRLDVARRLPLVAELHAKLAHVAIDDVALDLESTAPDAGEQRLAREHLAGV